MIEAIVSGSLAAALAVFVANAWSHPSRRAPARANADGAPLRNPRTRRARIGVAAVLVAVSTGSGLATEPATTPVADAVWTATFDAPVLWQRVTSLGDLVVATPKGLRGVDPVTGAALWRRDDVRGVTEARFEEVPGTSLAVVTTDGEREHTIVFDAYDGRVVFESTAAGIATVLGKHMLYDAGALLIVGFPEERPKSRMYLVDVASGKIRWSSDRLFEEGGKLRGFLTALAQATTGQSGIVADPYELDGETFLVASAAGIDKIDIETGEFVWRTPNRDGTGVVSFFRSPHRDDAVFVATEETSEMSSGSSLTYTRYAAYALDDGRPLWKKSPRVKGPRNTPVFLPDGLVISPGGGSKGAIKFLAYADGVSRWGKKGKGIRSVGGIVDHHATDAGLVVTTGKPSVWSDHGTVYALDVLDPDKGGFRFPKPLSVKGRMLRSEAIESGVLYVTTAEIGVFDPSTGAARSRLVSPDSLLTADDGGTLFAFAGTRGTLHGLDKKEGTLRQLSEKPVRLKGKDRPSVLEIHDGRPLVLSSQNLVAFERDGSVRFHAHHPAPRHPKWMRALLIAQSVRAGLAAAASGAMGAAFADASNAHDEGSVESELTRGLSDGYGRLADGYASISERSAREATARFRKSTAVRDAVFMMVARDRGYGLARVDKSDGSIRSIVPLDRDRDPRYQVDDVAERVYYSPTANEVRGYDFGVSRVAAAGATEPSAD